MGQGQRRPAGRCFPPFPSGSISLREEFLPLDRIRRLVRSPTFAHRKVKEMRGACRAELRKGFPKENSDLAACMLAARTRDVPMFAMNSVSDRERSTTPGSLQRSRSASSKG